MIGISSTGKEAISKVVEELFDSIAMEFLGNIPSLANKKFIAISSQTNMGLPHLFVQAMKNKNLNDIEKDVLKGLLENAYGYIDGLKSRTRSNITDAVDGAIKQAKLRNVKLYPEQIRQIVNEEMQKARSHMKTIAESESTKTKNFGTAMDITRVAADLGDADPTVMFVIVRDGKTCNDCLRLHMMPDGITPRLWKLSQLKQTYGKRGDDAPSLVNRHPHCRCQITYLTKGFGFNDKGRVSYVSENYDAYAAQQDE